MATDRNPHPPVRRPTWPRLRPWLVVALVVVLAAAVTLVLLQSAGTIHVPFLGGGATSSGLRAP